MWPFSSVLHIAFQNAHDEMMEIKGFTASSAAGFRWLPQLLLNWLPSNAIAMPQAETVRHIQKPSCSNVGSGLILHRQSSNWKRCAYVYAANSWFRQIKPANILPLVWDPSRAAAARDYNGLHVSFAHLCAANARKPDGLTRQWGHKGESIESQRRSEEQTTVPWRKPLSQGLLPAPVGIPKPLHSRRVLQKQTHWFSMISMQSMDYVHGYNPEQKCGSIIINNLYRCVQYGVDGVG